MDLHPFVLKVSDADFNQRKKSVFDQLSTLEKQKTENTMDVDEPKEKKPSNRDRSFKQFKGKNSIFKRPDESLSKHYMRRLPDFKKNPHKWTKYTLEDVSEDDMSDKSNTKTALSFLNDLKKRNMQPEEKFNVKGESDKIVFRKTRHSTTKSEEIDKEESPVTFASSKVVMPEYVVGQKPSEKKKSKSLGSKKEVAASSLKLNHLFEEEQEDE